MHDDVTAMAKRQTTGFSIVKIVSKRIPAQSSSTWTTAISP